MKLTQKYRNFRIEQGIYNKIFHQLRRFFCSPNTLDTMNKQGRTVYQADPTEQHRMLSRDSIPKSMLETYKSCEPPPKFHVLDKIGDPTGSYKKYTNPDFFLEEWILQQEKELAQLSIERKKKRKERKEKKKLAQSTRQAPTTTVHIDPETGQPIVNTTADLVTESNESSLYNSATTQADHDDHQLDQMERITSNRRDSVDPSMRRFEIHDIPEHAAPPPPQFHPMSPPQPPPGLPPKPLLSSSLWTTQAPQIPDDDLKEFAPPPPPSPMPSHHLSMSQHAPPLPPKPQLMSPMKMSHPPSIPPSPAITKPSAGGAPPPPPPPPPPPATGSVPKPPPPPAPPAAPPMNANASSTTLPAIADGTSLLKDIIAFRQGGGQLRPVVAPTQKKTTGLGAFDSNAVAALLNRRKDIAGEDSDDDDDSGWDDDEDE
eukprot:TRINITY_DN2308_c1_g1_i2.p1 TRINITY_DN2308_c1_g1~~TRINITY_DN2308_c1_g1_i2.p1  ORF type:complete len:430 (+),score=191.20 TRINITY_DN2308_c1_g1_i2:188-1477(+)